MLLADGEWEPPADTGEAHRGTGHKRRGRWGPAEGPEPSRQGVGILREDLSAFLSGIGFGVRL